MNIKVILKIINRRINTSKSNKIERSFKLFGNNNNKLRNQKKLSNHNHEI